MRSLAGASGDHVNAATWGRNVIWSGICRRSSVSRGRAGSFARRRARWAAAGTARRAPIGWSTRKL